MTASVIATMLTTPETRHLSVFIGHTDVTRVALMDSIESEDAGTSAQGTFAVRLNVDLADYPGITNGALVLVIDHDNEPETMFRGFVTSVGPSLVPGFGSVEVVAGDHGSILDNYIPSELRPAGESDAARIGYLWGKYATGILSPDLTYVSVVRASMPAQDFVGVSLRVALDLIAAQASSSAVWYLEQIGRLHYFATESNDAPFDITS